MKRLRRKTCRSCDVSRNSDFPPETTLFDSHDKQQFKCAPTFTTHRKEVSTFSALIETFKYLTGVLNKNNGSNTYMSEYEIAEKNLIEKQNCFVTVKCLFQGETFRRLLCLAIAFGLTVYVLSTMLSYQDRQSQLLYDGNSDATIMTRRQSISRIGTNDYNKYLEDYVGIMKDINQDLKQMNSVNKELVEANKRFENFLSSILLDFRSDINFLKSKFKDHEKYGSTVEDDSVRSVHHELELYDADKIGMPDFALESSGGSVISIPDTETYQLQSWYFMMKMPFLRRVTRSPRKVIQPSVFPGECWPFVGSRGSIILQLAAKIIITAVTLEHIPVSLSLTGKIDSAPRNFTIFGLANLNEIGTNLGHYFYDTEKAPRQTFFIKNKKGTMISPFVGIRLSITSNHGNPDYTCVYRFRVHGHISESNSK